MRKARILVTCFHQLTPYFMELKVFFFFLTQNFHFISKQLINKRGEYNQANVLPLGGILAEFVDALALPGPFPPMK